MTLQNKTNQFFGNTTQQDDDEVVDLFDQYGGDDTVGEDSVSLAKRSAQLSDVTEQEEVVENVEVSQDAPQALPVVEEVRAWEKEMEGQEVLPQKIVAETVVTASVPHEVASVAIETTPASVVAHPAAPVRQEHTAVVRPAPQIAAKKSYLPPTQQTPSRKNIQRIDPSKKTIAIVDDDIDTLEMYATIFENADYNVIRASDGLEALSVIAEHTPHLIFTGIVMPRMDGFAMMEALNQNPRTADIPVVINSHLGRAADKQRAEELGARDFIVRGFTPPREALERIGALLLRSEYVFRFDATDPEARKLVKDLGASSFFVCPRGQEMVIKLSIVDPKELTFSARFSCMDAKK
jgi:CheY-like chemotaxis protein